MMLFFILLSFVLFLLGLLVQVSSLSKYTTFVSTEGEIIGFIEKIGEGKRGGKNSQWFKEPMPVSYQPVVAYQVGEKIYQMEAMDKKPLKEPDFRKSMPLVYNPYEPSESYIKEGTPFLGLLLMGVAAVFIIFLIAL